MQGVGRQCSDGARIALAQGPPRPNRGGCPRRKDAGRSELCLQIFVPIYFLTDIAPLINCYDSDKNTVERSKNAFLPSDGGGGYQGSPVEPLCVM